MCHYCGLEEEILIPEYMNGRQITCSGSVCGIEFKNDVQQLYLKDLKSDFMQEISCRYRIKIIVDGTTDIAYGNRVRVCGKMLLTEAPSNEGQFDKQAFEKTKRVLFTLKNTKIEVLDGRYDKLSQTLFLCRRICGEKLGIVFEKEDAGILSAMLLGDKAELDEETKGWYQAGGISHVLAISGLHISMIGMAIYRLFRKFGVPFFLCAFVSGLLMVLYAVFTGAGIATCRAVIMFLVFLGSQYLGRTYDLLCALSLAVILLLLWQPLLLFSAGFQMSVLAVAAIGVIHPVIQECYGKRVSAGISIQLVLVPCILWHYFTVSLYGVILNLAVIPLLPAVIAGGLLARLLSFLWPAAAMAAGMPVHWLLMLYQTLCEWADKLPLSQITAGRPPIWAVSGYYVILLAGVKLLHRCLEQKKQKLRPVRKNSGDRDERYRVYTRCLYIVFPLLLMMGMGNLHYHKFSGLTLSFLDVGQGDSIFIENENGVAMLCDGGSSSAGKVGKYCILPFLKYHGLSRLDYVFLTHMDADHINGVQEILEMETGGIEVGTLVLPRLEKPDETYLEIEALARKRGAAVQKMQAGDRLRAGKLVLTCLHPEADYHTDNKNEASLVLHVSYGAFDAMLMGDLEKDGERYLTGSGRLEKAKGENNEIELLKVGHHGSKGAASDEFLEILQPHFAILSYGKGNRYGHPAPELKERLKKAGCVYAATANCGEITILCDKNEKITIRYGKNVIK